MKFPIRVRFAPSPTGFMHVGNVRAALLNYLFAKQQGGTFVLRVEDTDEQRNRKDAAHQIETDLMWLGLSYDEGPFYQSEREYVYKQQLEEFIKAGHVYRCFCSKEMLEMMRERQRADNKPPRYDRTCRLYSHDRIQRKLDHGMPFIWRFGLDDHRIFDVHDLAKGTVSFDMSHFSDFAITREDGSFTFIFTNFIDDVSMRISHVIRGEDHLSNTGLQLAMYDAAARRAPTFWHLPLLCNESGQKMSKRDFGFSLTDLKEAGYLPEAIVNYLALIGKSVEEEIQTLQELVQKYNFGHISAAASVGYDQEKLDWFNHKWIEKLSLDGLLNHAQSFFWRFFPQSEKCDNENLKALLAVIRSELKTLADIQQQAAFYFIRPMVSQEQLIDEVGRQDVDRLIEKVANLHPNYENGGDLLNAFKKECKADGIPFKSLFVFLRLLLAGTPHGIRVNDLMGLFSYQEIIQRLTRV